jgi:hypothetical protein
MAGQNQASSEPVHGKSAAPMPVTPSAETERPEGLAFDVAKGADLSGVPVGDQAPANPEAAPTENAVHETGEGVGLAVPADPGRNAAKALDGEPGER